VSSSVNAFTLRSTASEAWFAGRSFGDQLRDTLPNPHALLSNLIATLNGYTALRPGRVAGK
jgi:hypothetical protein